MGNGAACNFDVFYMKYLIQLETDKQQKPGTKQLVTLWSVNGIVIFDKEESEELAPGWKIL